MKTQISFALLLAICGIAATGCSQPFWSKKSDSDPFAAAVQGRDLSPKPKAEAGFLQSMNPFGGKPKPQITQDDRRDFDPTNKKELSPEDQLNQELALARVLERKDDYTRALNSYLALEKKHPREPRIQHRLGIMAAQETKWDEAEKRLQRAIELGGPNVEILSDLGYLFYLQGKYDQAIAALDNALQYDVRHEKSLVNKGLVLGEMGKFDEAQRIFLKALDRGPAYANMGYVYSQLGDLERAKESYLKSLGYDPKNVAVAEALIQIDASVKFVAQKEQQFKENKINGRMTPDDRPFPHPENRTQQNQPGDIYSQRPVGAPSPLQDRVPPKHNVAEAPTSYPVTNHPEANFEPTTRTAAAANTQNAYAQNQPAGRVDDVPPPLSSVAAGVAQPSTYSNAYTQQADTAPHNYVQSPLDAHAPFGNDSASLSSTDAVPSRAEELGLTDPPLDDISQSAEVSVAQNNLPIERDDNLAVETLPSPEETVEIVDNSSQTDPGIRWRRPKLPNDGDKVATYEPVYKERSQPSPKSSDVEVMTEPKATDPTNHPGSSLVEIVDNVPTKNSDLATFVDKTRNVGTEYLPRQATSTVNQANSSMAASTQNPIQPGGLISQQNVSPAQSVGNAIPVYYGPKKEVEAVAETTLGRRDNYSDLKRRVMESQQPEAENVAATNAELTRQAAARPAADTRPVDHRVEANATGPVSQYGQAQPATTAAQQVELPPVLTPSEYYARQLAHEATAAQAGATQMSTQGMRPNIPAHPSTQTYQPHPQFGNGNAQAQGTEVAEQPSADSQPAATQANSRGLLPSFGLPSWLKR